MPSGLAPSLIRVRAWRDYGIVSDCSFRSFLAISTIERVPNPPGVGDRIMVGGLPATRCLARMGHYVAFMRDDSDQILFSHPNDVTAGV